VAGGVSQATLEPYNDPEAYVLYKRLFHNLTGPNGKPINLIIAAETTDHPDADIEKCVKPEKGDEAVFAAMIKSYKQANKTPVLLQEKLDLLTKYQLVSHSTIDALFSRNIGRNTGDGWENFYKKYPNSQGYWEVSAVGFSPNRSFAILYFALHGGWRADIGSYIVTTKVDGKWTGKAWSFCEWFS
jgi:hypothetical protein